MPRACVIRLVWTFDPATGELWTVVNERDLLGDDIPPDMVTSVQEGADYGWPFCYQGGDGALGGG